MPVPKRKTSKSRRDKRSSCKFIRPKAVTQCSNCSEALSTHQACGNCGFYKGKKVITTKIERTLRRSAARVEKQQADAKNAKAQATSAESHDHDQNHENEK